MTVATLKQASDLAAAAHDAERDRLAAAGLNSKARYPLLKALKQASNDAYAAYRAAAVRKCHAVMTEMGM